LPVFFKTFGCRTNIYDTQLMKEGLEKEGKKIAQKEREAKIVVVNSCTVTNSADRELKKYLRHLKKLPTHPKVILIGCGSYTRGKELIETGMVDLVLGHKFKESLFYHLHRQGIDLGDFNFINRRLVSHFTTSKGFIKIQEGCNFKCGYCIIPTVRGPSRSVPEEQVTEQVKLLVSNGIREIVLTGINMGSYGKEWGGSLSLLVEKLIKIPRLKRLRLGSLEPTQVDRRLEELLESGILERHLHIALQHTHNQMLRLMKRRNRVETTLPLFERLAGKGIALGTDFIIGHPGESERIWREGLKNFRRYPLTHIHLFRYSPREGTPSAQLDGLINGHTLQQRRKELMEIVHQNNWRFRLQRQLERVPLLVHIEQIKEVKGKRVGIGYDQFFNKTFIEGKGIKKGDWVELLNYRLEKDGNYGKV